MHHAVGTPASAGVPKQILFPAEDRHKSKPAAAAADAVPVDNEGPWDEEVLGPGVIGRLGGGKRGAGRGGKGEAGGGWGAKKTWEGLGTELRKRRTGGPTGFGAQKLAGAGGGSAPVGFTPRGAKVSTNCLVPGTR